MLNCPEQVVKGTFVEFDRASTPPAAFPGLHGRHLWLPPWRPVPAQSSRTGSGGVSPAQWFGRRVPCSRADRAPGPIPEVVRRSRPPLRASFATGHRGQVRSAGDLSGPDADRPGWPLQTEGFGAHPRRGPDRTSVRDRGGAKMPGKDGTQCTRPVPDPAAPYRPVRRASCRQHFGGAVFRSAATTGAV